MFELSATPPLAENNMRDFVRGCVVWFAGFPLSVIAAAAVLTAPVWITSPSPFDSAVSMVSGAAPVVAFFSLLPALIMPPSPRVWPYVAAGMRTGFWCGVIAFSMFFIFAIAAALRTLVETLREGVGPEAVEALLTMGAYLAAGLAVFAVAGAVGGFVFGLVAAEERRPLAQANRV